MPFEINKTGGSSFIGNGEARFSNTNHDLTNLNGTMLIAKLNRVHLGVFVSGCMRTEYPKIKGKDPHAETNLIQAMEDTVADLPISSVSENILSIKLSKSPCSSCTEALIDFQTNFAAPKKIKIRIKIMALYEGESRGTSTANIAKLQKAGIVCVPWHLEERFQWDDDAEAYVSKKETTKSNRTHELTGQSLSKKELDQMQTRTETLEKFAAMGSKSDYAAVRKPMTADELKGRIKELNEYASATEKEIGKANFEVRQAVRKLKDRKKKITELEGDRPPMKGTDRYRSLERQKGRLESDEEAIRKAKQLESDLEMKQRFIIGQIYDLEKQLKATN